MQKVNAFDPKYTLIFTDDCANEKEVSEEFYVSEEEAQKAMLFAFATHIHDACTEGEIPVKIVGLTDTEITYTIDDEMYRTEIMKLTYGG